MPKSSKNKSKKTKGSNNKPGSWTYLTSVSAPAGLTLVRRLTYVTSVSTAVGVNYFKYGPTELRASAAEWGSFAARYQQYRVIAIKVGVIPNNQASQSSTNYISYVVFSTDRSGTSGTPTSAASIFSGDAPKVYNLDYTGMAVPSYQAKAIDLEDQNYTSVATNQTSFQVLGTLQGNGSAPCTVLVEWMVEFKGAM